jgi:hypothetical protein
MANSQIYFWDKRPTGKAALVANILTVLSQNTGNFLTSHEIRRRMSQAAIAILNTALAGYQNSGFAEPSSHVGSLCAELSQQSQIIRGTKLCPVNHRVDAAFRV